MSADEPALKLFSFVKRKPGLGTEAFLHAWRDVHAPYMLEHPELARSVARYVLNVAIRGAEVPPLTFSDFDGVAELWFKSLPDLLAVLESADLRQRSASSTERFLDRERTLRLAAEEAIQFDRGFGRAKFIGLSRRHADMSHEEWCRYWIDVHGPLAHGIPEFTRYYGRYVHNYVVPLEHATLEHQDDFDGIVEEWVESPEEMARCLTEPKYLELVRPDELRFVDFGRSHMLLTEEHVVSDQSTPASGS